MAGEEERVFSEDEAHSRSMNSLHRLPSNEGRLSSKVMVPADARWRWKKPKAKANVKTSPSGLETAQTDACQPKKTRTMRKKAAEL